MEEGVLNSSEEEELEELEDDNDQSLSEEFIPLVDALEITPIEKKKLYQAYVSIVKRTSFSGPLPPPEILNGYNDAVENGAERIMVMAEEQAKHRRELESHAIKEQLRQSKNGQIFGFIIALTLIGVSTLLGFYGQPVLGGILGGTTLVSLVTVFVIGKVTQKKELKSRNN
jgi:uncharacterized membrane protein